MPVGRRRSSRRAGCPPPSVAERTAGRATLLVLAAILSVQFGAALAVVLVPLIGAPATVTFRLLVSAAIMLAISRSSWRGHGWPAWRAALLFGIALGSMNFVFYQALARLPIGVAVTIEFVGPLALAAALSRRARDAVAVAAALVGVVLISQALTVPWSQLDHVGILCAALAGAFWAMYILTSRAAGRHFERLDGLTWALVVAAVIVTPVGVATAHGPLLSPQVLLGGLGIAVLSSVLPYSLELLALRSMSAQVFGIMLALEPAVAALAGFLVLGQTLTPLQIAGMVLVAGASALVSAASAGDPLEDADV